MTPLPSRLLSGHFSLVLWQEGTRLLRLQTPRLYTSGPAALNGEWAAEFSPRQPVGLVAGRRPVNPCQMLLSDNARRGAALCELLHVLS